MFIIFIWIYVFVYFVVVIEVIIIFFVWFMRINLIGGFFEFCWCVIRFIWFYVCCGCMDFLVFGILLFFGFYGMLFDWSVLGFCGIYLLLVFFCWENVDSRFMLKKWKIEKVIFMKVFFFKYLGICGLEFFEVYGIIVYGEREISN